MTKNTLPKKVIVYKDAAGKEPFTRWLKNLRNPSTRRRVLKRLYRVENGNYGDYKSVGRGVHELRLFFGAGYRIYFGEDGDTVVVLLCGGDKDSQRHDIQKAQSYWKEYKSDV